jgi:hypothetical protein
MELGFGAGHSGAVTTREFRIPVVTAKSRGEPLVILSCLRPLVRACLPNLNMHKALCVQILDTTTPPNNALQQPRCWYASSISTV